MARSRAGRVFLNRPDRVAAAWRRLRFAQMTPDDAPHSLIEDVVEPFIREVGASLEGTAGSAWSRTRGVLRLSRERGAKGLFDEFSTLRRCLLVSLEALGSTNAERECVERAVEEATDSAVALQESLERPDPDRPPLPFAGVVLEVFEGAPLSVEAPTEQASTVIH